MAKNNIATIVAAAGGLLLVYSLVNRPTSFNPYPTGYNPYATQGNGSTFVPVPGGYSTTSTDNTAAWIGGAVALGTAFFENYWGD